MDGTGAQSLLNQSGQLGLWAERVLKVYSINLFGQLGLWAERELKVYSLNLLFSWAIKGSNGQTLLNQSTCQLGG